MTLIVGANLLTGLRRSEVGVAVMAGIIAGRYVVMPMVRGVAIVKAALHFGWLDPICYYANSYIDASVLSHRQ
ncbi:hypothetical protein PanWU01x14_226850 [Parasponia andersonii]|uniref:Uncharacterized protein n=1 Tax=Parasponia andersonii TaxID=3476 RepID=A0A2P5BMM9_PARAD|nr:hypothetical protein PanWU01x14_226850 [Parasponia andersonii]